MSMASTIQPRTGSKRARAAARRKKEQRNRFLLRVAAGVGIVLFATVFIATLGEGDQLTGSAEVEAWDLPQLDGEGRVSLDQFAGRPTVAAFFASWCEICKQELPGFAELSVRIGDEVNFVGINTMNNGSGGPFARQMGIEQWPLARDIGLHDGRQLATNFGARGSPTTVIYDASGGVVDVTLGRLTAESLEQKLTQFFGVTG